MSQEQPYFIGITGGSASGKTTLAHYIKNLLGQDRCGIVFQDSYYHDLSQKDPATRNFDHPDAIDFELLKNHLVQLKKNESIELPDYDFKTHSRSSITHHVDPKPIMIVEGILVLSMAEIRAHFDLMIFVNTPEDLRFRRRLERDVRERGRKEQEVRDQFFRQVAPMHNQFIEPCREQVDFIIPGDEPFDHHRSDLEFVLRNKKIL